ncbi:alpha-2-macroglobulin-like protein 1 [Clonorchis sinensis]|uniref:Alpha-2-macroglobulin-like protein 1 n=1 Tax=Clonorchis sinensis TaxID=79923 RepID=G7YGH8_CLOSI|nr:alpha-2-macroglobulin-like protein 1 [Clonorchis sinensis]
MLCLRLATLLWLSFHATATIDPDAFITVPSTLYVEHENLIAVRTLQRIHAAHLITTIPSLNHTTVDTKQLDLSTKFPDNLYGQDISYKTPFVPITEKSTNVQLNFSLTFCANPECTEKTVKSLTADTRIARRPVIVLGETDKPVYRPGENVRFRFLTLTPQFTVPLTGPINYPTQQLVGSATDGELTLATFTSEHAEKLTRVVYDDIYVKDDKGNRLKRWLNVSPAEAANLSYSLLADAREGTWTVVAHVLGETETLSFSVKHYVLPRFVMEISPPKNLTFESNFTEYSVCARYTNGPPMSGSVRSYLCVCDKPGRSETDLSTEDDVMITGTCPGGSGSQPPRPCVQQNDILQKDGCVNFSLSTEKLDLKNKDYRIWGQHVVVCAEVEEEGTGSNVTRCEVGSELLRRQVTMEITAPSVYKPGLPISIALKLNGPNLADAEITVECSESWNSCFRMWHPLPRKPEQGRYQYSTKVKPDSTGYAQLVIPPPSTTSGISVKAIYSLNDTNKRAKRWVIMPPWNEDQNSQQIVAYAHLSAWESLSGTSMQAWPNEKAFSLSPSGLVTLNLMANVPLLNKILIVQTMVRGKVAQHIIRPLDGVTEYCEDRDDNLGHYRCQNNTTDGIECLHGWQGKDCLQPICAPGCSLRGGFCEVPWVCKCRNGWTGSNCEICLKREGCVHGQCVDGNDCVCDEGWQGHLCQLAQVQQEQIDEVTEPDTTEKTETVDNLPDTTTEAVLPPTVPRRTLYQRNISFPVDGSWGPEATVVIYFYNKYESTAEIIPAVLQLKDLENYTSPAMALQTQTNTTGIRFDRNRVSPGQAVELTVNPAGVDTNALKNGLLSSETLSEQVCFIRLSDVALDNFDGKKNLINLETYAKSVEQLSGANVWRPTVAKTVEEAFQAAGMYHTSFFANERIRPDIIACPLMSMMRSGPQSNGMEVDSPVASPVTANLMPGVKPRLRDFFPEVWLFEAAPIGTINSSSGQSTVGVQQSLRAPDSITTWRASAFCTTKSNGLWIPDSNTVTVSMPFFLELTLPKQVKRGEIIYLPVSVFVVREEALDSKERACYEVRVSTSVAKEDWLRVGVSDYSGCVCSGEKQTFQLGLMPQRLGQLNVTAEAYAISGSPLCDESQDESNRQVHTLSDMIRRQIRVIPEGVPKEATFGDILCLPDGVSHGVVTTPVSVPPSMIPGSLRVYLTYTDEVLGPALSNLDSLVRLPTGCGEQNMVLVAPNVYVLEYLKSGALVSSKEREKLMHSARMHIMKGYKGQLKYRLEDGSYSAFGQSDKVGSTWLTAFVLRVFTKAYRVDRTLSIDWDTLFNETFTFLKQRQDLEGSGCFVEKGRVIQSSMQGGLGGSKEKNDQALLTAYVLSSLYDLRVTSAAEDYNAYESVITNGIRCIKAGVPRDILLPEPLSNVATYGLAQVSYVLQMYQPEKYDTELYLQELIRRRRTISDALRGPRSYWPANQSSEDTESSKWAGALDVETTSYAYLTLAERREQVNELFSIVRWLSTQQTSTGGFRSTQDTILAMQAIAHAATRLLYNGTNPGNTNISLSAKVIPSGYKIDDVLSDQKRQVVNQIAIPHTDPKDVQEIRWEVNTDALSATHCVALQTALFYNIPEPTSTSDDVFTMTATVVQSRPPPGNSCITATLTTCLRLASKTDPVQESGMLLIRVQMVSGWRPVQEEILKLVGTDEESVRRVEFDDDGTVSLYFNGFTSEEAKVAGGWSHVKRCVELSLRQTTYVDSTQPALISAMDYYATERSVMIKYQLEGCKSAWLTENEPPVTKNASTTTTEPSLSTSTPKPRLCPKCQLDSGLKSNLSDSLYEMICSGYNNMFMIHLYASDEEVFNVTMIVVSANGFASTWNATINRAALSNCSCESLLFKGSKLVWIAPEYLDVSLGETIVSLVTDNADALLLAVEDVLPDLRTAQSRFEANSKLAKADTSNSLTLSELYSCKRIKPLIKYIEKRLLSK